MNFTIHKQFSFFLKYTYLLLYQTKKKVDIYKDTFPRLLIDDDEQEKNI